MQTRSHKVRFSLRLETRFYIAAVLSVSMYFIAASIGSGWVLCLTCAVLASMILSIVLPVILLLALKPTLHAADTCESRKPLPVRIRLEPGNFLFSECRQLILEMVPKSNCVYTAKTEADLARAGSESKTESNLQTAPKKPDLAYIEDLSKENSLKLTAPALKRGLQQIPELWLTSSYPLGMCWISAKFSFEEQVVVLPHIVPLEGRFIYQLKSSVLLPGDSQSANSGMASAASKGVRAYVRGDSRRNIHWSLSARHGKMMVKERDEEGLPAYDIVLDAGAQWKSPEQFELAITSCASLIAFGNSAGIYPELFILDGSFKQDDALPERIVETEEQMRALATRTPIISKSHLQATAIESGQKYSGLMNRPKAVIVIFPAEQESGPSSKKEAKKKISDSLSNSHSSPGNRIDPRSRSSLFRLAIGCDPNTSLTDDAQAVLHNEKELSLL